MFNVMKMMRLVKGDQVFSSSEESDDLYNMILEQTLKDMVAKLEKEELYVQNVAREAKALYDNRQRKIFPCECSLFVCSSLIEDLECYDKVRSQNFCINSTQEYLDPNRLGIHFPSGVNVSDLSDELKTSICIFRTIDKVLGKGLIPGQDTWTYLGTNTGYYIEWPLIPDYRDDVDGEVGLNYCLPYDCRTRPWYSGAVSGPRDLIIMVDASITMTEKWSETLDSATAIIETLSFIDHVGILMFSDKAYFLVDETFELRATGENKKLLREQLYNEVPSNYTADFQNGMQRAFEMFRNMEIYHVDDVKTKYIILISDGHTVEKKSDVLEMINSEQTAFLNENPDDQVIIHSLIVNTSSMDTSLPNQITCEHRGLALIEQSDGDIFTELNPFASYNGLWRMDSRPVWIEPYLDFSTNVNVTTVSQPVFTE